MASRGDYFKRGLIFLEGSDTPHKSLRWGQTGWPLCDLAKSSQKSFLSLPYLEKGYLLKTVASKTYILSKAQTIHA